MIDPASKVSTEVLDKMVHLNIIEPNEIEWLECIIKEHAACKVSMVLGVTGIDADGAAYGVHVRRADEDTVEVMLDVPSIAVLRSLGRESSMREIARPLRTMPYTEILQGDGSFRWRTVQLRPAMSRLRMLWIEVATELIGQTAPDIPGSIETIANN